MRTWLIVAGALLLAAAVAVSGLVVTHSGSHESTSMRGAIFLACGPIPVGPNAFWRQRDAHYLDTDGSATLIVPREDKPLGAVIVKRTRDEKFTIEDCNWLMGVHG